MELAGFNLNFSTICLFMTASIIACLLLLYSVKSSNKNRCHDPIAGLMVLFHAKNAEVFWFSAWFIVSAFLGIVLPFSLGSSDLDWFLNENHAVGLLITINYTLFVSLLVGAYTGLTREVFQFLREDHLGSIGLIYRNGDPRTRSKRQSIFFKISMYGISFLTLAITYSATKSIISTEDVDTLSSPWVYDGDLSIFGALYYTLRGINAYMALGLIALSIFLFLTFAFSLRVENELGVLDKRGRVKNSIQKLVISLSICSFLGPLVVVIHGMALLEEHKIAKQGESNLGIELLVHSTWLYWVVLALVSTVFLLFGVFWFYRRVGSAVFSFRESMELEVEQLFEKTDGSLDEYKSKMEAFDMISERIKKNETSPIPQSALVFVAGSISIQAINIAKAVIDLFG